MTDDQIDAISADLGKGPDHYAFMREFARAILQAATRDAPSADAVDERVFALTGALMFAEEKMRLISKLLNEGHDFIDKGRTVEIFADQLKVAIATSGSKGDGND